MTAQQSERLINDSDVDLGFLEPYFVRREDNTDAFPITPVVPESALRCSALWRGAVATMRLLANDRLELERFEFPFADNAPSQICNAYFTGDFTITFRPFFFAPSTKIPFRDGFIVRDRHEWQIDDQTLTGVVSSVLSDHHTNKPIGLRVAVRGLAFAFAPKSLVPPNYRDDLESLVGCSVNCTIAEIDEDRSNIILKIEQCADD